MCVVYVCGVCVCVHVYVCMHMYACHSILKEVRGMPSRISYFLPPCNLQSGLRL